MELHLTAAQSLTAIVQDGLLLPEEIANVLVPKAIQFLAAIINNNNNSSSSSSVATSTTTPLPSTSSVSITANSLSNKMINTSGLPSVSVDGGNMNSLLSSSPPSVQIVQVPPPLGTGTGSLGGSSSCSMSPLDHDAHVEVAEAWLSILLLAIDMVPVDCLADVVGAADCARS